jgi:flagellar biosynthesis protein
MATRDPSLPAPRFESLEPPRLHLPAGGGTPVPIVPAAPAQKKQSRQATPAAHAPPGGEVPTPPAPLLQAAAITYRSDVGAPRVVAKGRGLVAEQIIARAKEHGVAVHESRELVALLMQVELDDHIPPALYRAVAELLAWLYRIEAARLPGGTVS